MASRRGLNNNERLAVSMANVTATGAVVAAPCYVYSLVACLADSTVSGKGSIGNTTAAADLVKETTRVDFRFGTAAASGNTAEPFVLQFSPPLYCENQLFHTLATSLANVSVSFLPAS